jgi:short-subunit dehydrogenase
MAVRLKPLAEQVIVITGATSGIGLATARAAVARGARVVLGSRNEEALQQLVSELNARGERRATHVAGDVANRDDMERLASHAVVAFGGIDTWVNDAGVSIYGKLAEVEPDDHRRLFETDFWGVVHGSLVAIDHLRERGGALINVGSANSDYAAPLQGAFSATKHAVKGYTDALRMEVEAEGAPVSITLVKPGAIDTPYTAHARSYLDSFPKNPPPVYAPRTVARAILHAARHPQRDVFVGFGGKAISALGYWMPRTLDRVMERSLIRMQESGRPRHGATALHRSASALEERGEYATGDHGHVARTSLYTALSLRPVLSLAIALLGVSVAASLRR